MKTGEPFDFAALRRGIYQWLVDVAEVVPLAIWEKQNVPQPDYPYASMLIIAGPTKEGGKDELRTTFDAGRPNGEEIERVTGGPNLITIALSFHNDGLAASKNPDQAGISLAARAQASLGQQTVLDHLSDAGLAVVSEEGVIDTSVVVNGKWLSRGTLDVRFRVTSQATEYAGYIDKVVLESDELNVDLEVDAS